MKPKDRVFIEDEIVRSVIRFIHSGFRCQMNDWLIFILRCVELREKLILISKTSGEIEYDKVFVSSLFLRSLKRGLESNLILQKKWPMLRAQEKTNEDILSATQRIADDKRDRERNLF